MGLTRQQIRAEKIERARRSSIEIFNGGDRIASYSSDWTPEQAMDDLLETWSDPEESFHGLDLAVWRNGYLTGIIRQGQDGRPKVTKVPYAW
jgi:hypothetical protein